MRLRLQSIPIKICISILLIETILLALMGGYYVQRFEKEIDQRVKEKLTMPAVLMSQRALNFDAVQDLEVIGELIHEHVVDSFIVRKDGIVFFSAAPDKEGKDIHTLLDEKERDLLPWNTVPGRQVAFSSESGEEYMLSMAPIYFAEKLLGYLYITIHADNIEKKKRKVLFLFIYGSLLTIALTTLLEAFLVHRLIVPRIQKISSTLEDVARGSLTAKVTQSGPTDELQTLGHRVNTMIDAVAANIREISATKDKLVKSEERFRELADLLPETIFEVDIEGRVTYVNQKAIDIFQYNRDDFKRGIYSSELLVDTDPQHTVEMMKERINGEITGIVELTARRKDCSTFPVHVNSSIIYHEGKAVGLRGILVDITEKKRLQEKLQQAQKMEAIGRLVASIAHEFGNPLIGIHWLLRDLNKLPSLDQATRDMTGVALEECERMRHFLSDFQRFSRETTGMRELVDIHQLLDSSLVFYKKFLQDKKVRVVKQYQQDLPEISAIRDQINQVFVNLIMNGIEAMGKSGGELRISTAATEESVSVTVQDNGSGIKSENLDHIFEPFFSTKSEVEGMGLGLYVSYGIVQGHHGDIIVNSESGQGAAFTVVLPVGSNHPESNNLD